MRASSILLVCCTGAAGPALAGCPTTETLAGLCKPGTEVAAELAREMPVDLRAMRLISALATTDGRMVIAEPAIGGPKPDPKYAAVYLCSNRTANGFVASGGSIDVRLYDHPFLTLSSCEAP